MAAQWELDWKSPLPSSQRSAHHHKHQPANMQQHSHSSTIQPSRLAHYPSSLHLTHCLYFLTPTPPLNPSPHLPLLSPLFSSILPTLSLHLFYLLSPLSSSSYLSPSRLSPSLLPTPSC